MDAALAKKWMLLFNEKIQANKDYLSELDTPIGDGDHGGNMARGMAAVVERDEVSLCCPGCKLFEGQTLCKFLCEDSFCVLNL